MIIQNISLFRNNGFFYGSDMFNCCQLFRSFEKNADKFMLGKKKFKQKQVYFL